MPPTSVSAVDVLDVIAGVVVNALAGFVQSILRARRTWWLRSDRSPRTPLVFLRPRAAAHMMHFCTLGMALSHSYLGTPKGQAAMQ